MRLSRRTALLGAGAAAAVGPARAQPKADSPAVQALYEAAKKEGQVGWYSGVLDQPMCDAAGRAFTAKYPGIAVNAIKTTSQVAFQRVVEDLRGGGPQCDVFTTTDVGHMSYLISKQLAVKYTAEAAAGMSKALRDFAKEGYFQVSWVGQVVLLYNSAKVSAADSPKDWPDLTDAKWKDKISFGSPNYSGIVGVWSVAMAQKYGWEYFEKLNKLNPLIGPFGGRRDNRAELRRARGCGGQPVVGSAQCRQGQSAGGELPAVPARWWTFRPPRSSRGPRARMQASCSWSSWPAPNTPRSWPTGSSNRCATTCRRPRVPNRSRR